MTTTAQEQVADDLGTAEVKKQLLMRLAILGAVIMLIFGGSLLVYMALQNNQVIEEISRAQAEDIDTTRAIEDAIKELKRNAELQTGVGTEMTAISIACAIHLLRVNDKVPPTAQYALQIRDCAAEVRLEKIRSR